MSKNSENKDEIGSRHLDSSKKGVLSFCCGCFRRRRCYCAPKICSSKCCKAYNIVIDLLSSEYSVVRSIRYGIMGIITAYLLLSSPFLTCFRIPDNLGLVLFNHVIIDMVLYFDLILKLLTPYEDKNGKTIRSPLRTSTNYIRQRTRSFLLDVIITIPFSWLFLVFPIANENMSWFRLNRILVFLKVDSLFSEIERYAVRLNYSPSFFRIIKFLLAAVFFAHIVACLYFLIVRTEGKAVSQLWTKSLELLEDETDWSYQYFFSLYFSYLTLMGYGGFMPISDLEVIFTTLCVLVGIGIYVTIIGAVGSLMLNMGRQETVYRERNEQINVYMKRKSFSEELKDLVNTFYNYVWHVKKGLDECTILEDLPVFLRRDISRFLNKKILEQVPIFKDASDSFISEILVRLKTRVALPNTYIIREGETGREMFFLSKGEVKVVVGEMVVHTFTPGSFFGEIALINKVKRTASCVASDFCDLYVLEKYDFEIILDNFREEAKLIRRKAHERVIKEKEEKEKSENEKSNDDEEEESEEIIEEERSALSNNSEGIIDEDFSDLSDENDILDFEVLNDNEEESEMIVPQILVTPVKCDDDFLATTTSSESDDEEL